jgi:hypothetical protein
MEDRVQWRDPRSSIFDSLTDAALRSLHGHVQSSGFKLFDIKLGSFSVSDEEERAAAMMGLPHFMGRLRPAKPSQLHDRLDHVHHVRAGVGGMKDDPETRQGFTGPERMMTAPGGIRSGPIGWLLVHGLGPPF